MSSLGLRDTVARAERGREFWRRTLLAGPFTVLPRWTREPAAGVGEHEARVPDDLVAALRRLADELAVSFHSVLLTAHAKVLAALSGEREVSTGYLAPQGRSPLLCRITTAPRTWRAMLMEAHRAVVELLSHADFPVEDLGRELSLTQPLFETVFDPAAAARGELAEDTVLRVGVVERDGIVLRLRHRTDVLDT
ncbi:MAG: non-ribosomal peptide synthetase, partial [Candidatus Eisenbacteria bacterium]